MKVYDYVARKYNPGSFTYEAIVLIFLKPGITAREIVKILTRSGGKFGDYPAFWFEGINEMIRHKEIRVANAKLYLINK